MPIKSFRGLIVNGAQDTISLHTNDGSTGYRIVKFQVIGDTPVLENQESVIKIYKVPGKTVDATIDFSDNTLLAVGVWSSHSSATNYPEDMTIIFDNEVFNQDIYVLHSSPTPRDCNYYIELEQVKLDLNQNTVATLKNLRNS
jgi:hypothetical protein